MYPPTHRISTGRFNIFCSHGILVSKSLYFYLKLFEKPEHIHAVRLGINPPTHAGRSFLLILKENATAARRKSVYCPYSLLRPPPTSCPPCTIGTLHRRSLCYLGATTGAHISPHQRSLVGRVHSVTPGGRLGSSAGLVPE